MTGLLRLTTARPPDRLQSGKLEAIQLGMTAPQARQLAGDLLKMAAAIEAQPKGTAQ